MANVVVGLIYLRAVSLRNMAVSRILRLKQPKYLLGAAAGIVYVHYFFFRRLQVPQSNGAMAGLPLDQIAALIVFSAAALLGFFALCWVWSRDRASLAFNEAEMAFLFPAPVARKTLIHFRLIDMQLKLMFSAFILALFSARWGFLPGNGAIRFFGWWILFSTINLHIIGSAFTITHWSDRGIAPWYRRTIVAGSIGVIVAISWFSHWRTWPAPEADDLDGFVAAVRYFSGMLDAGAVGFLLMPLEWVIRLLFAADFRAFLVALGPACLVLAVHYLWVLRSEVSFEEASIAAAQKRATRLAAMRSGHYGMDRSAIKLRRTPFKLSAVSRAEAAFLWKNLLSNADYLSVRNAVTVVVVIVIGCTWLKNGEHEIIRRMIGSLAFAMGAYALLFGPLLARQDFRNDLPNADILKTYPLSGWQIALGEMLTPVVTVTVAIWLLLLTAALAFEPQRAKWLTMEVRVWGSVGAALLTPLLCAVQVLVLNAAALLFPAWMQGGVSRGGGIDVMGQRILFLAALLIAIVASLIPAAIAAGVVYFFAYFLLGKLAAIALAGVVLLAALCIEVALGIQWLGTLFEKFDLSAELRP